MLDIFSWAYLPFTFFVCVCEVSAFIFRPFKKFIFLLLRIQIFIYSGYKCFVRYVTCKHCLSLAVCYFISYKVSLTEETIWILLTSNRSILSSMDYAFGVTPKCNWTCKWLMATPSFSCGQGWPCHPVLANRTCSCKRSFNGCSAPSSGLFHLSSWSEVVIVLLWPWDRPHPGIAQWKAKDNAL